MKISRLFGLLGIFVLISISCTPTATPTPQGFQPPVKVTTPEKEAWEMEWGKAIADARKEERVLILTNAGSEVRATLTSKFKDKYGLSLEFVVGTGTELVEKLSRERRAGLFLADIYLCGGTHAIKQLKPEGILDPITPMFILPEVKDPKLYYDGKLPFADRERFYILSTILYPSNIMFFNKDLAKTEDLQSYKDLLRPRWKGKIAMGDPTIPGACFRWFSVVSTKLMDLEYMRQLAKQEPFISRNERLIVESVARGKYIIGVGIVPDYIAEFMKAGAPIESMIPVEGTWLTGGPGVFALINNAPHPNAAKVFTNWFLSKEGQTIYSQTNLTQSSRIDVPTDHLDASRLRDPKMKYFMSEDEDFLLGEPEYSKNAREIFGPLLK